MNAHADAASARRFRGPAPRLRAGLARACCGLAIGLTLNAGPRGAGRAEAGPAPGSAEISVFAAASLADALSEIGAAWAASSAGRPPFLNFGGSSDLARQIRAGAPADVFFSADAAQMDGLEREGLVRRAERVDLLSNTLVVVVPAGSAAQVRRASDLATFRSIALADPQAVPAGVYARTWLERLGLWGVLLPRVVPALHVRAALAAVESGNVEAGIVYRTDAARSSRVRVALQVPREDGPAIVYPVAPVGASRGGAGFVAFLQAPSARETFARHGFLVLGGR
jgi:molybdate transport system substrate-binding protein